MHHQQETAIENWKLATANVFGIPGVVQKNILNVWGQNHPHTILNVCEHVSIVFQQVRMYESLYKKPACEFDRARI